MDELASHVVGQGDDDRIKAILADVCDSTGMGFAAVARVTEDRWIACQVMDRIDVGLDPGGELDIKKTICDDIRRTGQGVVIDNIEFDTDWRTHPIPHFYGFKSYISLPIVLPDGRFYGTLCAMDVQPGSLSGRDIVATVQAYAARIAQLLVANTPDGIDPL